MHTLKSFLFYLIEFRVDFIIHHAYIYVYIYIYMCVYIYIYTHIHGIIVLYVCDIGYIKVTEKVKSGNILFGC